MTRCIVPLLGFILLVPLLAPASARALEIRFESEDLEDVEPGADRRLVRFTLSDVELAPGQGVSVRFDPARHRALEVTPLAPGSPWDVVVVQPDPLLPDHGLLDVQAPLGVAGADLELEVRFVWSGPGQPGAQPYVVYGADFRGLGGGITVPEPGALAAALAGLAALAAVRLARR